MLQRLHLCYSSQVAGIDYRQIGVCLKCGSGLKCSCLFVRNHFRQFIHKSWGNVRSLLQCIHNCLLCLVQTGSQSMTTFTSYMLDFVDLKSLFWKSKLSAHRNNSKLLHNCYTTVKWFVCLFCILIFWRNIVKHYAQFNTWNIKLASGRLKEQLKILMLLSYNLFLTICIM